jgi:hypothetical protein
LGLVKELHYGFKAASQRYVVRIGLEVQDGSEIPLGVAEIALHQKCRSGVDPGAVDHAR